VDKLLIEGGKALSGEVAMSGAKNAALPILCASLLTAEPVHFTNVPHLNDISTMLRLLGDMGVGVTMDGVDGLVLNGGLNNPVASYEMVKTMRASILVLGPWSRAAAKPACRCRVAVPSGTAGRPAHQGPAGHGCRGQGRAGLCPCQGDPPEGARICTDMVTVTGTENLMMAACLAEARPSSRTPRVSRRWSIWPTAWFPWAPAFPAPAPTSFASRA
jgi:UDP-N-acetylglucosamine 1-carboxyvinyltransferase